MSNEAFFKFVVLMTITMLVIIFGPGPEWWYKRELA